MPNLAAPAGATPSLLSLLTPVAAAPAAAVDGGTAPSFADIVAGLTATPDLPLSPLPTGQTLPVERPELAGQAPDPAHDLDPLLAGCGWSPEPLLDGPAIPILPVPTQAKPIARLDPAAPDDSGIAVAPVLAAAQPIANLEPDQTPVRETVRLPLRAAALASVAKPLIADVASSRIDQPLVAETASEPQTPGANLQAAPEPPARTDNPEPQPIPVAIPVAVAPSQDAPTDSEPNLTPATIAVTQAISTAPLPPRPVSVEAQAGTGAAPQQAGADSQPDAQPQPQPQPKPTQAAAAPTEMRIAPELARQVAQMIQPALERAAMEPHPGAPLPIEVALPIASTPAPQPVSAPAPAQPTTFQSAPVDLGRAGWVESMIERIAEMPQVDRREAQIKLLPDMLGKVEVTLVERDERVHVTLNAETVQARQLLAEAAPRLQELAEARGLRLAQTEIGGGTSQDRRAPQDQNQPQTPQRPRSAQGSQADETSTQTGDRIA